MKKLISIILAIIALTTLFTGCSSSSAEIDMTIENSVRVSDMKFKDGDLKCVNCSATEDVCTINLYESTIGEGEPDIVPICKSCCNRKCDYCGGEGEYLCFSLLALPLILCEKEFSTY